MTNETEELSPEFSLSREALGPHDINEEGSDMTRDIFFAILKDTRDGPPRPKSLPDQSEILHEDVGASYLLPWYGRKADDRVTCFYVLLLVLTGKASDIAQPGGFRRDHVIANLEGDSPHVPSCVQDSFLESIQPTRGFLQSAYGDFIVASLDLAADDDDSDVRDAIAR